MANASNCADCGTKEVVARGRCRRCYNRHRDALIKAGDYTPIVTHGKPLERLLSRAARHENGCLLYAHPLNNRGYGQISVGGKQVLAHRAIYELLVGPIPDGLDLDHTCHNSDPTCMGGVTCVHRRCIDIEHLEPVPGAINTKRGRGWVFNGAKTHCPQGHPYDEANTHVYDGRRYCRACNGRRKAATRAATHASEGPPSPWSPHDAAGASR